MSNEFVRPFSIRGVLLCIYFSMVLALIPILNGWPYYISVVLLGVRKREISWNRGLISYISRIKINLYFLRIVSVLQFYTSYTNDTITIGPLANLLCLLDFLPSCLQGCFDILFPHPANNIIISEKGERNCNWKVFFYSTY